MKQILRSVAGIFGVLLGGLGVVADEPGWVEYYKEGLVDEAYRVTADGLGGVYIAGQTKTGTSADDLDPFLVKYDSLGNFVWDRRNFGGPQQDTARGLATDPFGGIYVAGAAEGWAGSEGGRDGFLAKFDPDGKKLWAFPFGWEYDDGATGVAATDEAVYVCGYVGTTDNKSDVLVKVYSHRGAELGPPIQFGGSGGESAADITTDAQGNLYLAGTTSGDLFAANAGSNDIFVTKLNPQGGFVWKKQFGTDKLEGATHVDLQGDVLYVCGHTHGSLGGPSHGGTDPFVMALDRANGNPLWTRQLGTDLMEFGQGVHADSGDNVHLGVFRYAAGPKIYKLDESHNVVEEHATGSASRGSVRSVYGDGSGTIYVTGREGSNQDGKAFLARFYSAKKVLDEVPDYHWNYGCAPTAAAMMMGYWDRKGFNSLDGDPNKTAPLTSDPQTDNRPREGHREEGTYETGPPNSNSDVDRMIASEGHHKAFWARGLDEDEGANIDYEVDGSLRFWTEFDCLADYLGTSQGRMPNGFSPQTKAASGLSDWAEQSGLLDPEEGQVYVGPDDFKPSFEKLKTEIDLGAPVLLDLCVDGVDTENVHTVLAYGYIDFPGFQWFAVRDTWQDGNSDSDLPENEDEKIEAFVDDDQVEWWEWKTKKDPADPKAFVTQMNTFHPIRYPLKLKRLFRRSDGFDRPGGGLSPDELGYEVFDLSSDGSGSVLIGPSPLDPENPVLQITSVTGEAISVADEVHVDPTMELSFAYLFQDPGEVEIFLGDTLLDLLETPGQGPGSPGSGEFATYREIFDVGAMGFAPWSGHDLRFTLKAPGDPTFYLDDLVLLGIPAAVPVPEPSAAALLTTALLALFAYVWRRRRVA